MKSNNEKKIEILQILVPHHHVFFFFKTVTEFNYCSQGFFKLILNTLLVLCMCPLKVKMHLKVLVQVMAVIQTFFVEKISSDKKHFPLGFTYGYY